MLALDNRLNAILNEIDAARLADIGSDHGKVVVKALLEKRAKTAVAVDISKDSLDKARRLAKKYNIEDKITFICSDGLNDVENADCIVIAGMGAYEIVKILGQKKFPKARYITVPHQDTAYLRRYLMTKNFEIKKDYVVKDGEKFYNIIVFEEGLNNYTDDEIYTGKNQPETPYYREYLLYRKQRINNITRQAGSEAKISADLREEKKEIDKCLTKLEMS